MLFGKFRRLTADTICAPRRGSPPVAPDGYEPEPGDPYVFHIKLPPCEDREERIVKRPCCDKLIIWCKLIDTPVTRWSCVNRCPKNAKSNNTNDDV